MYLPQGLLWTAPEILRNNEMCVKGEGSMKGDVYSFGMVLYEISSRCEPYSDSDITPQGN